MFSSRLPAFPVHIEAGSKMVGRKIDGRASTDYGFHRFPEGE
jgi:hypothetical protein